MLALLPIVVTFVLTAALAWQWGQSPERWGSVVLLAILFLAVLRRMIIGLNFQHVDLFGLISDVAIFACLFTLAQFAWRIWPLWAASLQLLAILGHLVRMLHIEIHPMAYYILRTSPTYLVWLALVVGILRQRMRSRAGDSMPCWRNWSRR